MAAILDKGGVPFFRRAFTWVRKRLFAWDSYHLFTFDLESMDSVNEADFAPSVGGFTFREIAAWALADELESTGARCPWMASRFKGKTDTGAVAFCTFIGEQPAHIMWVAVSDADKDLMKQPPVKVGFSGGEYCTSSWTNPEYRRAGFARYTTVKASQALRDRGFTRNRYAVLTSNVASLNAFAVLRPRKYAEAVHLKVLRWGLWRETPVEQPGRRHPPATASMR